MRHLRKTPRIKIDLQRTIPVRIHKKGGKALHRYVRVLDLSEGGMRLSGDLSTPDGEFELELDSRVLFKSFPVGNTKLELRVVQRWQKDLYGDMWMGGFQFLDIGQEQLEIVRRIIKEHNQDTVEPAITAEHKVNVGIKKWGKINWYYPLISKLDNENIEFRTTEVLNIKGTCKIALAFRPSKTTVELEADLVSRKEIGSMQLYKLSFKNPSEQ